MSRVAMREPSTSWRLGLLGVALALSSVACGGSGVPTVSDARIGQPTGPNAALYFTASGYGEADRLLSVSTDVASLVEIHESMTDDTGMMTMMPVESLDLPADGDLVLEPGGYHIMLLEVDQLEMDSKIEVVLHWEKAGSQTVAAMVVSPADTMSDG